MKIIELNAKECNALAYVLRAGRRGTIERVGKDKHLAYCICHKRNKPIPRKVYDFLKINKLITPQCSPAFIGKEEFPALLR